MQSALFGDTKIGTSVGRKATSRAQMRKLLMESNAATVNNRRGHKRCSTKEEQEQSNNQQPVNPSLSLPQSSFDSKAILAKTLHYLNADSLEKERQKNAQLMIRNVQDKLTLRRCNEDLIGQQELDRCHRSKRKPDQALLDRLNVIANEIASLEMNMINERAMELAAASSSDATIQVLPKATMNQQRTRWWRMW